MTHLCPSCAESAIPASGPKDAKILILGEFPGEVEMEKGRPFVGPAGKVLRVEMAHLGIDMHQLRITNLWIHPPTKNENCYKVGYDLALEEAKGRRAIFLIGSEVVSAFTAFNVSNICGIRLDSIDHPFSCKAVMAMPNPAIVFHKACGEVRFGTRKFYEMLEQEGLIDDDDE